MTRGDRSQRSGVRPSASLMERRLEMVRKQLAGRGISDQRVLDAMSEVPRDEFVPEQFLDSAYKDGPLPIGHGQTISQPYTVAFMCQALKLQGDENVLEIGTGCGYAAAVLSKLARRVHTIERIEALAEQAAGHIRNLGLGNVEVHCGDGSVGLPEQAPFDAMLISAGAPELPAALREQLADGGRIVLPAGARTHQQMYRFTRNGDELHEERLGAFSFVPLIGAGGWDDDPEA